MGLLANSETRFLTPVEKLEPGASTVVKLDSSPVFVTKRGTWERIVKVFLNSDRAAVFLQEPWDIHGEQAARVWLMPLNPRFAEDGIEVELISQEGSQGDCVSSTQIRIRNQNADPVFVSRNAFAKQVLDTQDGTAAGVLRMVDGGECEFEITGDERHVILGMQGWNIGLIKKIGDELWLYMYATGGFIELSKTPRIRIGRAHQSFDMPVGGFVSREHMEIQTERLANGNFKVRVVDLNSKNGSIVEMPHVVEKVERVFAEVKEKARRRLFDKPIADSSARTLLRGEDRNVTDILDDSEFVRYALCNDTDGELNFHRAGIYAATTIGGRESESNEDGVYANPEARMIAGGDGVSLVNYGELAVAYPFAYIHTQRAFQPKLNDISIIACAYLAERLRERGIAYGEIDQPSATFGYAREREHRKGGKTVIEGFIIGDYRALIVDMDSGEIVYASEEQTELRKIMASGRTFGNREVTLHHNVTAAIANAMVPYGPADDPAFFSKPVPPGKRFMTLLFSDGVSGVLKDDEIAKIVLAAKECAGRKIIEEAENRSAKDNISVATMISVSN